jgi:NUMOD3 motif
MAAPRLPEDGSPRTDFYVYCLYRDEAMTTPFYIGKGCGHRWTHSGRSKGASHNLIKKGICAKVRRQLGHVPSAKVAIKLSEEEAHEIEINLIRVIGRRPYGPLANLTDGGGGLTGYVVSQETRDKLRAANLGKKRSEEARAAMRGKRGPASLELRAYQSATRKGRKLNLSDAERERRRTAATGKVYSEQARFNMRAAAQLREARKRQSVGGANVEP